MNVIVTGAGRNKGIGAEICRVLSKSGNNIYYTSYDQYDIEVGGINTTDYILTKQECSNNGQSVYFGIFDLSHEKGVKALFDDAIMKIGQIDALVNCLCYHKYDVFGKIVETELDNTYKVNVKAILLLCQEFYLRFNGKKGSIVNLSSMQHLQPLYSEISYATTKASVPIISSTLSLIMAKKNININSVNPGSTNIGDANEIDFQLLCKKANSFGRTGTPGDVANIVKFLLSEEGQWITGQTIDSEGAIYRSITECPL